MEVRPDTERRDESRALIRMRQLYKEVRAGTASTEEVAEFRRLEEETETSEQRETRLNAVRILTAPSYSVRDALSLFTRTNA